MSNIAKLIRDNTGIDLDKAISDCIESQPSSFTVEDCIPEIEQVIYDATSAPEVRLESAKNIARKLIFSEITARKNMPIIDKNGQYDFFAFHSLVIGVSHGVYVNMKNASVDAYLTKKEEQEANIAAAIKKRDDFASMGDPIMEYALMNGIETMGEAMEKMGKI